MHIQECMNSSHIFPLSNGSSLRIRAQERIYVKNVLITQEIRDAEKAGIIILHEDKISAKPPKRLAVPREKEVTTNG